MGLFSKKTKKELIPEVDNGTSTHGRASSTTGASSIHSAAPSYRSAYVPPSQGGAGYAGQQSQYARPQQQQQHSSFGASSAQYGAGGNVGDGGDRYGAKAGEGDRYGARARGYGGGNARNELMAGAPAGGASRQQASYGEDHRQYEQGDGQVNEEDEEVEGIKQQMRFVKQESLASTRNAVRIAREAEETARATLDKLGDQSDRIANTERHLDLAKAHNDRAQDETKELEALNRSIFRPNMTWNKSAKRDKEEARILARHNAEKAEREDSRRDQYESRQRIDQTYRGMDREAENAAGARARARARGAERGRYQFEATASDDEVEDEIDSNLDEIGGLAGRLKMLATTAGQEVDAQNNKLSKLGGKVDSLDTNVVRSTQRLARVK